ncbi:UNVERIFIED_CONTAM: hypothetical protein FKN15_059028 [Acipenser sinensis]
MYFPTGNQNRNNNHLNAISNIALEPSQPKAQAPLPEVTPPEPCLKPKLEGVLVNHKEPRPSSKLGLRVHFKLPNDKERETSSEENDVVLRHSLGKENSNDVASNAAGTITVESSHLKAPAYLPEATPPDPTGCLKPKLEGVLVNHNEPRSSSKAGLRVHFKLPEDDKESETSPVEDVLFATQQKAGSPFDLVNGQSAGAAVQTSPVKEPPPVLAKPKLLTMQPPKSYSVGGQRSSRAATGKPAVYKMETGKKRNITPLPYPPTVPILPVQYWLPLIPDTEFLNPLSLEYNDYALLSYNS